MRTRGTELGGGLRPPADGRRGPFGALLPASPQDGLRGRSPRSKGNNTAGELVAVRVKPRARRNEVVGQVGGVWRVRVTAAPEGGAANRAVIGLLAEALGIAPSRVELVRGAASRDKLFRVERGRLTLPSPRRGEGIRL
jgi:uncharacterized protein (TIGR00251 family)